MLTLVKTKLEHHEFALPTTDEVYLISTVNQCIEHNLEVGVFASGETFVTQPFASNRWTMLVSRSQVIFSRFKS